MIKSPFFVIEEFISPKVAEYFVDSIGFITPNLDIKDNPIKTSINNDDLELKIFEKIKKIVPQLEEYYDFKYTATEQIEFSWFAEKYKNQDLVCENSSYLRKKWVRHKHRDFTGVLFLSDYNETVPFDSDYEVYGGKLEFPQYGFSFHPQRGQLVVYPSGPHFINAISPVLVGDCFIAKFHIRAEMPYLYDPSKFPGDFKSWF